MNPIVIKIEQVFARWRACNSQLANQSNVQTEDRLAHYFVEQLIAMFGTTVQQLLLNLFIHKLPVIAKALGVISPHSGPLLIALSSALTWILLTVWTFKMQERLRLLAGAIR